MSKLNNLVQKATNTAGNEEEASAKYSGMTGTPEIKEWYATHGEDVYILSDSLRLHGKRFKKYRHKICSRMPRLHKQGQAYGRICS